MPSSVGQGRIGVWKIAVSLAHEKAGDINHFDTHSYALMGLHDFPYGKSHEQVLLPPPDRPCGFVDDRLSERWRWRAASSRLQRNRGLPRRPRHCRRLWIVSGRFGNETQSPLACGAHGAKLRVNAGCHRRRLHRRPRPERCLWTLSRERGFARGQYETQSPACALWSCCVWRCDGVCGHAWQQRRRVSRGSNHRRGLRVVPDCSDDDVQFKAEPQPYGTAKYRCLRRPAKQHGSHLSC